MMKNTDAEKQNQQVTELLQSVGSLAELSINYYRTLRQHADTKDALALTVAFNIAFLWGGRMFPNSGQEG